MTTQAEIFDTHMCSIWNGIIDVKDDEMQKLYNERSDARDVASVMGAKPTGKTEPDDNGHEWLFPDGSTIWILNDGSGTTNNLP